MLRHAYPGLLTAFLQSSRPMDQSRTTGAFPPRELLNADGELLLMNSGEEMLLELEVDDIKLHYVKKRFFLATGRIFF